MRIAVFGDPMSDINYEVKFKRHSPEANCPIYDVISPPVVCPGGSSNVVANLKAMEPDWAIIHVPLSPVSMKNRYFVDGNQVFRVDRDSNCPMESGIVEIPEAEAYVVSDYGKNPDLDPHGIFESASEYGNSDFR